MTQEAFALMFDSVRLHKAKRATIGHWENGRHAPSLEFVLEFAAKYSCSLDDLFTKVIDWDAPNASLEGIEVDNLQDWDGVMKVLERISKVAAMVPDLMERIERLEKK